VRATEKQKVLSMDALNPLLKDGLADDDDPPLDPPEPSFKSPTPLTSSLTKASSLFFVKMTHSDALEA